MRKAIACSLLLYLSCAFGLCAQAFQNLDFEQATVAPTSAGTFGGTVDPSAAFPGWTVGVALSNQYPVFVLYNDLTLGSRAEVLIGPEFPNALNRSPLEGLYSAILQFGPGTTTGAPFLSQTGLVPSYAKSITFLATFGTNALQVSLNGTVIPLTPIDGGRLAGDVSAFAGRAAELMFTTTLDVSGVYFDDIQFSPDVIPEPSSLSLLMIGVLGLASFHRTRRKAL
jgi:hypothetical protein